MVEQQYHLIQQPHLFAVVVQLLRNFHLCHFVPPANHIKLQKDLKLNHLKQLPIKCLLATMQTKHSDAVNKAIFQMLSQIIRNTTDVVTCWAS